MVRSEKVLRLALRLLGPGSWGDTVQEFFQRGFRSRIVALWLPEWPPVFHRHSILVSDDSLAIDSVVATYACRQGVPSTTTHAMSSTQLKIAVHRSMRRRNGTTGGSRAEVRLSPRQKWPLA
jgi:hypothetical protein